LTSEPRIVAAEGIAAFEFAEHNCFACGSLNEHGLGMTIHIDRARAWSELTLEPRFEGWTGVAHGGILATLLDEIMGWTMAADDDWGVTARLAVDYRKPVPVGSSLRVEGWITRARRRVVETSGRVVDRPNGVELATATATYVLVDEERKQQLRDRYGIRRVGGAGATPEPVAG
jgi:acyl-coenzyme A thioesterase PaaI-like protein